MSAPHAAHLDVSDLFGGLYECDRADGLDDCETRRDLDADGGHVAAESGEDAAGPMLDGLAGWASMLDAPARRLRERVLELMERAWLPVAAECFARGRFPRDLFEELGSLGAIGASLCGDGREPLSRLATCATMHALEYGDGGLRCAVTIQDSVIQALLRFGDDTQQARWLEPLRRGRAVASFALTEPGAGSDLRALGTRATRKGGDWIISGRKAWITNAPQADVLLVWARTGEGNDAIRGFLVDRATPGLSIEPSVRALAMRAAPVGQVALDDVRVPQQALLPHAWGLVDVNACLDYNRMTVIFGAMGAARFCLEEALRHAGQRRQFGAPLGSKQLVQAQLADMTTQVVLGELLSLNLAMRWQAGPPAPLEVSLAKRNNCAAALEVARNARALLGACGIDLDRHVIRHLLNLEASYTYGGTHDIHGLVIGKSLTRESAF